MTAASSRPTSRDVAHAAGVSQATVSLVLGQKWQGRVSPRTAEVVRSAARRLGYRPNLAARSLRTGSTRTVMLVVPALTSDFFAHVHTGAAQVATKHDFGVVLYPSPEGVGPAPDPFGSARAPLDGVIASSMAAEAVSKLHDERGLPLVMLDSEPEHSHAAATVNVDIADGMRQVTAHLLALGHQRFAHVAADVPSWTFRLRGERLAALLSQAPGASLVGTASAQLSVVEGQRAAEKLLALAARPTALVCDDDILAAGACKAARRLGLRVPQDVSVTGFDDLPLASALEPELTTVRLPAHDVGATGMRTLLAVLEGQAPPTATLPVSLVERGTSAVVPR